MSTEDVLNTVGVVPPWVVGVAVAVAVVLLVLLVRALLSWGKGKAAHVVQWLSTGLGLAWSAQGMYDVATDPEHYHLPTQLAIVLCFVFESYLVARMLVAQRYSTDLPRRRRHVQAVWTAGVVMALVVSLGEGWAQAPARLAVPLLIVYGWYMDLTADDDPAQQLETEWNWTLRKVLVRIGAKKYAKRDQRAPNEAERQALRDQLARLGLADEIGVSWLGTALRRRQRLAALIAKSDPEVVAEVRERVARASAVHKGGLLGEAPAPEPAPRSVPWPQPPQLELPPRQRRRPAASSASVHRRVSDGAVVENVRDEAVRLERLSIAKGVRGGLGYPARELMMLFDPPLLENTAERAATEARKLGPLVEERINGNVPEKL